MAEYTGPVCFVGQDHEAPDGRTLEGGWHYTVVPNEAEREQALLMAENGLERAKNANPIVRGHLVALAEEILADVQSRAFEMPGEKLFSDGEGKYRLAKDGEPSHAEQFPGGLKLIAVDGGLGDVRTPEEFEAAHRHLDELEQRLADDGVHEQEQDHILTTQKEIDVMRDWLTRAQS